MNPAYIKKADKGAHRNDRRTPCHGRSGCAATGAAVARRTAGRRSLSRSAAVIAVFAVYGFAAAHFEYVSMNVCW